MRTPSKRDLVCRVAVLGLGILSLSACAGQASLPSGEEAPGIAAANTTLTPPQTEQPSQAVDATLAYAHGVALVSDDPWTILLERTPYPFLRELPPDEPTIVDGAYAKLEPHQGTPSPCRRCAPYRLEGGVWVLSLNRGVFRIHHELWIMRYFGSYSIVGDQIEFYNDPTCTGDVGVYRWSIEEDGALVLEEVDDPCPMGTRPRNLTSRPWRSCRPPNEEAAVTGHWNKPEGCL